MGGRPVDAPFFEAIAGYHGIAGTLAALRCHLPEALVSDEMDAAVCRVGERLPAALTQRIYLECRLCETSPAVDLVFCIDENSRAYLLGHALAAWLPPQLRDHPVWAGLARLCARWADPTSHLHGLIYDLWLEFDAGERSTGLEALVPSVFVGFASHLDVPRWMLWAAAREALELLSSCPMAPSIRQTAEQCIRALPHPSNLLYVGHMYPRDPRGVRLCLAPIDGLALARYLEQISWPGTLDYIQSLFSPVCGKPPPPRATLLHLDIQDVVQPRLGFELRLDQRSQLRGRLSESGFLDHLCHAGLCTAAKRDGLLAWPGHSCQLFPHQLWRSLAVRRVSHIKLVAETSRTLSAKAYLSIFHGLPTSAGRRSGLRHVKAPGVPSAEL